MYEQLAAEVPLSQGDVLDDCPLFSLALSSSPIDLDAPARRHRARVVVLTQACDLALGKTERTLVASVHSAAEVVAEGIIKASMVRDQVRRGLAYGWYFLPASPTAIGLPESIVDLRNVHTAYRAVLNQLIVAGKQVCRIVTPYREHLAQHFAVTYMRIGLPEPYETKP